MKHTNFTKKTLAVAVSTLISTGAMTTSWAAENEENVDDEIIVITGIRGSLTKSMHQKREESGVMDAINAEEMGKFPDTNLAESLQRITGVSVSRANGEGSQITVRGFGPSFNLITLNGRQMPGTGNSRSYNFENLSSNGVSALEVYKTARAENPSGGLGATINIVTTKPLTSPGLKYSTSVKAIHDSSNVEGKDVTPELSAMYSDTFNDDTFGVAFSMTHHRRDFQQQSANIQGWQANVALPANIDLANVIDYRRDADGEVPMHEVELNGITQTIPVDPHFFPRDMNYSINNLARERINGHLTFQYAPTDEIVAAVDFVGTKATTGSNSIGWGMWNDYGGNINAYEIDENGTVIYADISGNDGSYTASRKTTKVKERSIGLNLAWQATETLSLALDYHDSKSENNNGADKGLGSVGSLVLGSDQLGTKIYDYRTGDVPHSQIYWNNGTTTLGAGEIDSHFSQFVHSPGESSVKQLQIDGVWENYDTFDIPLINVKFGLSRTKQEMSGSNAWSGLIGGFLFNPSWPEMFPDGMFTLNNTNNFLDSFSGGGSELSPNYYYTFDFDEVVARSAAFLTNDVLGGDDYFATTAYHDMGTYSESSLKENTDSIYLQTEWDFDIGMYPVKLNFGFRYEQTEVPSSAMVNVPSAVWWKGGSEFHTQYSGEQLLDFTGDYNLFLPMLDIKVDITDELVGRASWGKTITRAPLGNLNGSLEYTGSPKTDSRTATQGLTGLLPYESTNFDLSLEYYYDEGSYASIGYYRKDVKNFIGNQSVPHIVDGILDIYQGPRWQQAEADIIANGDQATNDAIFAQMQANGATLNDQGYIEPEAGDPTMIWTLTQPFNSPETKTVDGFEVAVQHMFGETGFGFGVNATVVDGDVVFDVDSLVQQTVLIGLSDSANFQGFYEKDGLSVKITYAWRDQYLIGIGQDQGSSDNPPQYAKEFGQWDMSVNYDYNDNLTVFLEAINLNDETEQGFGRYEEQFLFARQYGPRYAIGARYTFR